MFWERRVLGLNCLAAVADKFLRAAVLIVSALNSKAYSVQALATFFSKDTRRLGLENGQTAREISAADLKTPQGSQKTLRQHFGASVKQR